MTPSLSPEWDMRLEILLQKMGGAAAVRSLTARGIETSDIRVALRRGDIVDLGRRRVALPGTEPAYITAVTSGALLTCLSAADAYGLWVLEKPATIHLHCNYGRKDDAVNHRRPPGLARHTWMPVLALTDVLIHALLCQPALPAAVIVESAIKQKKTTVRHLRDQLQGHRTGKARSVLDLIVGDAGSAIEVVARLLFMRAGIHVDSQVELPGVGWVDFLLEGTLVVEVDGFTYHSSREAYRRDRRRDNAVILLGYKRLRFTYEDIMYRRDLVLEQVLQVLSGRVTPVS